MLDVLRLVAWLALLAVLLAPLERRWAVHRQRFFRKAFGTDVVYYFLSGLAPKLLTILPLTILAATAHRLQPSGFYAWVGQMPIWLRLSAAMVVGEIGAYWGHRWSHEIPFLWRFHSIHHSSEELDWLVSARAHPIDKLVMRFAGLIPMYLLGLAQPLGGDVDLVPMIVSVVSNVWGYFIHTNVKWRLGWFEWIISSPAFHHWHHTNDGPELLNKNYAPMLPWVDWCFGTFYLPRKWPQKYGTDSPMPSGLADQLLQPLLGRGGGEIRPELSPHREMAVASEPPAVTDAV